ncbi:hypothetical protein WJX72_004049 [[Myrmecia] bisecta]|uniref:TOG domain-containing protein n=1 Tax=[Myrmecia] bisecta TaxID=41462 RepID=A0AAW1PWK1_9CHLO
MADEEVKVLAEAKNLPFPERVAHKNWKVRAEAYDDIKAGCQRVFNAEDPVLTQFAPLFVKGVGDSNAAALDKALDALQTFLEKANEQLAAKIAPPVCSALVSKVLKQRPGTVKRAGDVFLGFMELEQADVAVEALVKGFSDKVPKTVIAAIDILTQAVSAFGAKVVGPKAVLAALPSLFDAKQDAVRDGAKKLTAEMCCWVGVEVVQNALLDKMNDAMRKDVEKLMGDAGKKRPERFTRKEQAKRAAAGASVGGSAGADAAAGPAASKAAAVADDDDDGDADAYDFSDPVNILGELKGDFYEALQAKKWTERRDALLRFKALAKAPKLASGDYGDVMRELRKIIVKDSNVVCVAEAINCCGALAKGLRKEYANTARSLCPVLLDKFTEKKTNVCTACAEALTLMQRHCFGLADVADELGAALDHKNPKVKLETVRLLVVFVNASTKQAAAQVHKTVLPAVAKSCNDPALDVREAALLVMAAFALKSGSLSVLDKVMDKLDDSRKKKLEDTVQEALKSGGVPKAVPSKAASPLSSPVSSRPGSAAGPAAPAADGALKTLSSKNMNAGKPPPSRGPSGTKLSAGPSKKALGGAATATSSAADNDDAALSQGSLSKSEAEEKLGALFGEGCVAELQSAAWQARLNSMNEILRQAQDMKENLDTNVAVLIQGMSYLPGWAEKNFQVLSKAFELITYLAKTSPALNKKDAFVAIGGLVDKMADIKLKGPAGEALTALSEALGPRFVFTQLHKKAAAHKNPKVLSESVNWMATAVEEFGLGVLDVKALLDWMKTDLASSNATVRNAAIALLAACHKQLGPGLSDMIRNDVKPALMTALEDAFKKNPQQQVVPTRRVRSLKGGAAKSVGGPAASSAADVEDEPLAAVDPDDLLPRTDISAQITPRLVALLGDANWKSRNAGLEEVEQILQAAGGRIQPSLGDLMPALKGRMNDSNRNITARTLLLLGELAKAMGPAFDRFGRPVLASALTGLSDSKSQVRNALVTMLEAWVTVIPAERILPMVGDALAAPKASADGKVNVLKWMSGVVESGKAAKCLEGAVKAATLGSQDKSAEVREAGSALMSALLTANSADEVSQAAFGLDGATRKLATEAMQKAGGKAAAAAPKSSGSAVKLSATTAAPAGPKASTAPAKPAAAAPAAAAGGSAKLRASSSSLRSSSQGSLGKAAAVEEGVCLQVGTKKDERAHKARFQAGKFAAPREDEIEALQQDLETVASEPLQKLLFGKDFKQHMDAAGMILQQLPELSDAVLASLDLLFKWVAMRVCDGNTQSLLKILELCQELFNFLIDAEYQITEYEAQCLMPTLVEKAGHNQDRIRQLHHDLLKQARAIYPTPKVLDFVTQGLASKNTRTRVVCTEVIGEVVDQEGVAVCDRARQKPIAAVAQLVSEKDKACRAAALATLEIVYLSEGQSIWSKQLSKVTDAQRSLLEERFKYTDKQAAKAGVVPGAKHARPADLPDAEPAQPSTSSSPDAEPDRFSRPGSRPSSRGGANLAMQSIAFPASVLAASTHELDYNAASTQSVFTSHPETPAQPRTFGLPNSIPTPVPAATPAVASLPGGPLNAMSPALPVSHEQRSDEEIAVAWSRGMLMLHDEDPTESVEGMKLLCYEVMEAASGKASPATLATLAASANELVMELTKKVHQVFDSACAELEATGRAPSSRGCKYSLNTLMQTFQLHIMASAIAARPLRECISALLCKLLDERVPSLQEGGQLLKALNVLMLKILDNSNRSYSFGALLVLLRCPPEELHRRTPENALKFSDLVVKCLIKLTKALQTSLEEIELDDVLLSIHSFFMGLGVDEIRRRGAEDDKPLRMVKTILHELCKLKGHDIRRYMAAIPSATEPAPIIQAYVDLNLQTLQSAGLISPAEEPAQQAQQASQQAQQQQAYQAQPSTRSGGGGATTPAATLAGPRSAAAASANGAPSPTGSAGSGVSPPGSGDTKPRLAAIFKMIGDKGSTERGLEELFLFQREFPDVDISPHLSKTSPQFRQYIERGLHKVEKRMSGGAGAVRENGAAAHAAPAASTPAAEPERLPAQQGALFTPVQELQQAAAKPAASASPSRLEALRERMNKINSGAAITPVPNSTAEPERTALRTDTSKMMSTMETLQERMATLRGRKESQ